MRCIVCGKEFKCKPSEVERGRRFCSRSCKGVCFGGPKRGVYGVMGDIIESFDIGKKSNYPWGDGKVNGITVVTGVDIVNKVIELATPRHTSEPTEHDIWLAGIRKSIKQTGHAYKYDSGGLVVGEYDVDGNLKEY